MVSRSEEEVRVERNKRRNLRKRAAAAVRRLNYEQDRERKLAVPAHSRLINYVDGPRHVAWPAPAPGPWPSRKRRLEIDWQKLMEERHIEYKSTLQEVDSAVPRGGVEV